MAEQEERDRVAQVNRTAGGSGCCGCLFSDVMVGFVTCDNSAAKPGKRLPEHSV
jgi:hypothetical protein